MFNLFSKDIGIDLGTASVLVYIKGKGVVLREPSVVAMDKNTGKLLKVGTDAQAMLGRTPGNIVAMRPLREGVISDYDMTERMLKEFIKKVTTFSLFKPVQAPSAHLRTLRHHRGRGARRGGRRHPGGAPAGPTSLRSLWPPPSARASTSPSPTATWWWTSAAAPPISPSSPWAAWWSPASIKIAGDKFDEAVVKYIRKKHNVLIGDRTAEELKMSIGCVFPPARGGHHGDQGPLPDDRPAPGCSPSPPAR